MNKRIVNTVLVFAVLLTLLPAILLLVQSLYTYDKDGVMQVGFAQYAEIFQNARYWNNYKNSLILTVWSLVLALPIGILSGLLLAFRTRRWEKRLMLLYFIALMMPFQVIMLPLFQIAVETGLYDTHASIILLNMFAPLGVLVCWMLIKQIDSEQWDAVLLETSSVFAIIRRIILPQIAPGLLALAILLWSEAWNMVEQPLILLPDKSLQPLSIYYNDILNSGASYAGSVLYAMPVLMLFLLAVGFLCLSKVFHQPKKG